MLGWGLVAAVVAAYDVIAIRRQLDTLCATARRHPPVVVAAMVVFVVHLWPPRRRQVPTPAS